MKKSVVVVFHIGFWVCYLLLMLIMLGVFYRSSSHDIDQTARVANAFKSIFMFAFLPSVITFYMYYFLVFPKYLQQKKFLLTITYGILISLGASIIAYSLHRYLIETGRILDMDDGGKHGRSTFIIVIVVMTIISSISGLVALVIKGFITWFEEVKLKEQLKEKNVNSVERN